MLTKTRNLPSAERAAASLLPFPVSVASRGGIRERSSTSAAGAGRAKQTDSPRATAKDQTCETRNMRRPPESEASVANYSIFPLPFTEGRNVPLEAVGGGCANGSVGLIGSLPVNCRAAKRQLMPHEHRCPWGGKRFGSDRANPLQEEIAGSAGILPAI